MPAKSEQLQIRVTARQKAAVKRRAEAAGLDVSAYVLSRVLPESAVRFGEILDGLRRDAERRFALADLHDFLAALAPIEYPGAVAAADLRGLAPVWRNYIAAMVEQAAEQKKVPPAAWAREIEPLDEPHFTTPLRGLRLHLLRAAPVAFKRRNIFVDAGVGSRV
jgi:uncharacterized protein (DUF1778 family)